MMNQETERALKSDRLIDITTIGRKTGKPHKVEIGLHNFDGVLYISGRPGPRDWYANLVANPRFTIHLKQSTRADVPATAMPITDEGARRQVLSRLAAKWGREDQIEAFVQGSPLVEVRLESD